ncbi:MAG: GNAT family N-acetyltransferase [Gemmatimonas sp.]|nr:GNAT family N-acetyltransferase [Gemmatimonas sp.]
MSKAEVRTRLLPESEFDDWNRFVGGSPDGSIYSSSGYLDALCTAAGGRFRVLIAHQGDEILGGIGLYERDTRFGAFVSPRLLLYYNGPVLRRYDTRYPSRETSRRLKALAALESGIAQMGYLSMALKARGTLIDARPFLARGWSARVGYSYVVRIDDLEAAWAKVEQNLRRLVGRCERESISFTDDDDFDSFFRLHAATMERNDAQVYLPRTSFHRFFLTLRQSNLCRLYQARLPDGRTIASQLVLLGDHPTTHTVSAGGDPEFMGTGASAFLRWRVFEALSALGYAMNDLTDASLNQVTQFKAQLGGDLDLWLEVYRPQTRGYRFGSSVGDVVARARGVIGGVLRRGVGQIRRGT